MANQLLASNYYVTAFFESAIMNSTSAVTDDMPDRDEIADSICMPFPYRCNVNVNHAHEHSIDWATSFKLIDTAESLDQLRAAEMAWMVAGFYPDAGANELDLAADYLCWAFSLDDIGDNTVMGRAPEFLAPQLQRLQEITEGKLPTHDDVALAQALADVVKRLAIIGSPADARRFASASHLYFDAMLWESQNRAAGIVPEERTYYQYRPAAGAVPIFISLIEPLEKLSLPQVMRSHPVVSRLEQSTGNVLCWINDVLSYEKERGHNDVHNLIIVLSAQYGLTLAEGLRLSIDRINEEVHSFLGAEACLPHLNAHADKEMLRYCAVLRAMMAATFHWTLTSKRYDVTDRMASSNLRPNAPPSGNVP